MSWSERLENNWLMLFKGILFIFLVLFYKIFILTVLKNTKKGTEIQNVFY